MTFSPTQPQFDGFRSGRLWSLWDMAINFQIFGLTHLYGLMQQEERLAERDIHIHEVNKAAAHAANDTFPLFAMASNDAVERAKGLFAYAFQLAKQLELDAVADRVDRFTTQLRLNALLPDALTTPIQLSDLQAEVRVLREAFEDGLRYKYFWLYPRDRAQLVLRLDADWAPTIAAFKLPVKAEIMDAVDCYGLDKTTAAVFHLMRVAEYGLRALARERKVKLPKGKPLEWGTWQDLIKEVKASAEIIAKTKRAGAGKDEALAFYNGAVAHFDSFKDKYRNAVSHVRKRYDATEAEQAIRQVRDFMNGLSLKVGEETKGPIKWKF